MSLAHGHPYLAIPGPSAMPDRVLRAMHRAAPNIYAGELPGMMEKLTADLRAVAGTRQNVAIYIANGHGAWEAANSNMFSRGDKALVLVTGRFGEGWAQSARRLGVEVDTIDFGKRAPVDTDRLAKALADDPEGRIKAVLVTHIDTASSVRNDVAAIRATLDAAGHPALLAVDTIASLGCAEYRMDDWGVDITVGASQKGLMTPPGLGFLWFSDKARAVCEASDLRSPYWDWTERAAPAEFYQYFGGTAPTHHLYGLREALDMIAEEGMEAIWARHDTLARAVWAAFEAWGQGVPDIALNIADPAHRARSVTAARLGAPHATALRDWTEKEAGVTLGIGLGMAAPGDPAYHGFLRVAHMGHVNAHMTLGAIAVMEAGLRALQIPHSPGGIEAATAIIAGR